MSRLGSLVAGLLVGACTESGAPSESTPMRPGFSGRAESLVMPNATVYSWTQGNPPTAMGGTGIPGIKRVCYLSRVDGRFTANTESVRIERTGGTWYLTGSSATSGVSAQARCIAVIDYSSLYTKGPGAALILTHGSRWMCFITSIRGEIDDGDYAHVSFSSGKWRIGVVAADGSSPDLQVGVRCARPLDGDANARTQAYSWTMGQTPIPLEPSNSTACALTLIGGGFNSSNSYVTISSAFGSWWLSGGNLAPGVTEMSQCMS